MNASECVPNAIGRARCIVCAFMRILFVELTSSQYLSICGHPHAFHAHSCVFMRIPCAFHAHPDANPACSRIPWHPCASRHISCGLIRIHAHPMCSHASTCILMGPRASTRIMCSLICAYAYLYAFVRIRAHSCALHTHSTRILAISQTPAAAWAIKLGFECSSECSSLGSLPGSRDALGVDSASTAHFDTF